jgi:hypothetical protein
MAMSNWWRSLMRNGCSSGGKDGGRQICARFECGRMPFLEKDCLVVKTVAITLVSHCGSSTTMLRSFSSLLKCT